MKRFGFALFALLVPAVAMAAGGGHGGEAHGIDPKALALQFLNFGVLVAVIVFAGGKLINRALAARHDQMKKDLDEASQARVAAETRLKQQEQRLGNIEKEITKLRESIKEEAEKEQARLLAAAEEKAARIKEEARFLMDQQVKEAEQRFRQEVAAAAVLIAEDMVRRSLQIDDETRLNAAFIGDLERSPNGKGAAAEAPRSPAARETRV